MVQSFLQGISLKKVDIPRNNQKVPLGKFTLLPQCQHGSWVLVCSRIFPAWGDTTSKLLLTYTPFELCISLFCNLQVWLLSASRVWKSWRRLWGEIEIWWGRRRLL